ncbi:NAD(P)/FAD-dependent oxidoreductase [Pseudonocardia endophytica]|uniref:D-arginine dehydrogenase n=1 Tax=Pseudonocardia endophytica TaxID=401976 RepID=A0A4R1HWG7_PSEEN|nr:FAD-binding oxidoreductase [Pseudonocardia endophytica]TCK25100.1 D-arginine dehydrogenase [Pseudonocardia endophytica]
MERTGIAVVGGGIAGVSIARELAATRDVVLLEAETEMPRHSTARSAATYVPGHGSGPFRTLITASGPRFAALSDDWGVPLLSPRPVLWLAHDDPGEAALAALLAERAGEPDAPQPLTGAEAAQRCPVLRDPRAAAWTAGSADADAIALHAGYLKDLRRRGGRVLRGAPVTAVVRDGDGWRIDAGEHRILAGEVVDAAGAWTDRVAALAGVPPIGLVPHRRTIAACPAPDPSAIRGLPMVVDPAERFYFKPEPDTVLVSPGDETPVEPGDARPEEIDVALALERVGEATTLGLRSVRTAWAGLRSFVADRGPVAGAWPDHPGFWFFAGHGGSGIESAPAFAALGAAVVTGAPVPGDVPLDRAVVSVTRLVRR